MAQRMLAAPLALALLLFASPRSVVSDQDQPGEGREAGPLLAVAPASGPPGLTIEARGTGFLGDCGVNLFLGSLHGRPLAFSEVGAGGGFAADVTIPAGAAVGGSTLSAQGLAPGAEGCGKPSGRLAEAMFTVTPPPPSLAIDAFEGRPGTTVNFSGRGFCAATGCSTVTILIDGLVVADEVQVQADGSLSAQGMVPAVSAAGAVVFEAIQEGAGGEAIRAVGEMIVTVRPDQRRTVPQ
jgi:hypothetical protein